MRQQSSHAEKSEPISFIVLLIVTLIFLLGLYLRLKAVYTIDYKLSGDARNYHIMAVQLIEKGIFGYKSTSPNAYVTPGYPLFLVLIYKLFGASAETGIHTVKIIQAILGSLSIALMYFIGKRTYNKSCGIMAALFFAIYPTFIICTTTLLTEVFYTFFFLLYLLVQLIALEKSNFRWSFINGIFFGIAVLIRPTIFPLLFVPYLYSLITTGDTKYIKTFFYALIGLIVIMLPWWIRNVLTLKQFVMLATQNGNPLIGGAYPYFKGMEHVPQQNQLQEGIKIIVNGFINQPLLYIGWFTVGKFFIIFGNAYIPLSTIFLKSILYIHHVIIVLGFIGVLYSVYQSKIRFISIYIVLLTGLQLLFIPEARYAFPIMPLLIVLTSYMLYNIFVISKHAS